MADTKIEWTDKTWNPITGCTPISEGCKNCYAKVMAQRFAGMNGYPKDDPFKPGTIHYDKIDQPLSWRKPKHIFVCSMGDLFHDDVQFTQIERVFRTINLCRQHGYKHTFMVLTKRVDRMAEYQSKYGFPPNVWIGATIETQPRADERIPILRQIPAKVRFVSVEPMLSLVDPFKVKPAPGRRSYPLDWVICGSESGPGARPMKVEWAYLLCGRCKQNGVPFFYKQGPDDNRKVCKMPELNRQIWNELPSNK